MAIGLKIVEGDFIISPSGAVEFVQDGDKCLRDFGKMLKTDIQTDNNETTYDRYNPNYGNMLCNTQLYSGLTRSTTLEVVNNLVYSTIENYLALQESRANIQVGELILDTKYSTYYDPEDPRTILVPIKITNGQGLDLVVGEFEQVIA